MQPADVLLLVSSLSVGVAFAVASGRLLPAWDDVARRRVSSLDEMIESLGFGEDAIRVGLRLWGVLVLAIPVIFGPLFRMYLVVIPLMLLGWQLPKWVLGHLIHERKQLIRDQMVPFCFALANTARSGLALPGGLQEVVRDSPFPIRVEMLRVVNDFRRGRTIMDAIRDAQRRLKLDTFNIFSGVILTCYESGANYTTALDNISHSLQENQRLERRLAAETAGGRTVVMVLGGFPFFFLGLFYLMDPDNTLRVFSSFIGQAVLIVVGFLTYLSVKTAQKILAIEI